MKPRHKRLAIIVGGVASIGIAGALVLSALQSNVAFFFTPSQVVVGEALLAQPRFVHARPRCPTGVHDALAQKQFRDPVPRGHQIPAAVLPGPHKIPGRLLIGGGDGDRGNLAQMQ